MKVLPGSAIILSKPSIYNVKEYIIILNSDDLKTYEVKVKDNKTKEEEKISINDLVDYLDMHM